VEEGEGEEEEEEMDSDRGGGQVKNVRDPGSDTTSVGIGVLSFWSFPLGVERYRVTALSTSFLFHLSLYFRFIIMDRRSCSLPSSSTSLSYLILLLSLLSPLALGATVGTPFSFSSSTSF